MSIEGIYISADQAQALADWAAQARAEATAQLARVRAEMGVYHIHEASREHTQPGKVVDIREHIKKRYL